MKIGQIVTIYEKPVTEQEPEGDAEIREVIDLDCGNYNGRDMIRCNVRFDGENELYSRFILCQ